MISASPISRLSLIGAAVLLSLVLGGCANDEARRITFATWKQAEPVPQPQLVQVPVHHTVAFPAAAGAVTETEREALAIFLRRNGIAPGGRVTLSAALPAGADAALLGSRLSALRTDLAALGYGSATLPPGTSAGTTLPPDTIVVTARVLAVGAIPCPGYNTPVQLDLEHRPVLSPGCANAVNLGMMLAYPQDLQGSRTLAPADGAAVAPQIERYRTGQTWPASNGPSSVPFRTSSSSQ
jgi:pilus biogenesis lipoprotein CpaD